MPDKVRVYDLVDLRKSPQLNSRRPCKNISSANATSSPSAWLMNGYVCQQNGLEMTVAFLLLTRLVTTRVGLCMYTYPGLAPCVKQSVC